MMIKISKTPTGCNGSVITKNTALSENYLLLLTFIYQFIIQYYCRGGPMIVRRQIAEKWFLLNM